MSSRARYPPPGMGGGRGGMNPHAGPNPNFEPRNPTQQYAQRGPAPNNQNQHQSFQNPQPQQWLRRAQLPAANSAGDEVEKTVQPEAVDSSSHDWKEHLKLPPQEVTEIVYRYDSDCIPSNFTRNEVRFIQSSQDKTCNRSLMIKKHMEKPIYVYYQLDNFYQNHRR